MPAYTSIAIIYNPNSTGPSETIARQYEKSLRAALPGQAIHLIATEHAGHAEELAYTLAKTTLRPLIISASGDGGYHEVINGLIKAQQEGAHPTAGLLPAGNANDHHHSLHATDFTSAVQAGNEKVIDLLKLDTISHGRTYSRFGHSYIGLGLTPQAGRELNNTPLNKMKEIWIAVKSVIFLAPIHLIVKNQRRAYDSLIFSNIDKMSKVLSLAKDAAVDDGKFEITAFHRRNKLQLILSLLRASTVGLPGTTHADNFIFRTTQATLIQIDGEIQRIDPGVEVKISVEPRVLRCII